MGGGEEVKGMGGVCLGTQLKYITYISVLHICVKMPYETQSYV